MIEPKHIYTLIRSIRHHLGAGGALWDAHRQRVSGCNCETCRWHRRMARDLERVLLKRIRA